MNQEVFLFSPDEPEPPGILRAARFPLNDRHFETEYRQPLSHALHYYFYSGVIRTRQGDYPIHPGDVTLTPSGFSARYALEDAGMHLCIHFCCKSAGEFKLPFHFPARTLPEDVIFAFRRVIQYHAQADQPGCRTAAALSLRLLLFLLHQSLGNEPARNPDKLEKLVDHLERNLEKKHCVAELAQASGWSQTHLERLFKRQYGCTIMQYIMQSRIEKAQILLENSELSIKEIGMSVGYRTAQEFFKRFRQITGTSPSLWRLDHT